HGAEEGDPVGRDAGAEGRRRRRITGTDGVEQIEVGQGTVPAQGQPDAQVIGVQVVLARPGRRGRGTGGAAGGQVVAAGRRTVAVVIDAGRVPRRGRGRDDGGD